MSSQTASTVTENNSHESTQLLKKTLHYWNNVAFLRAWFLSLFKDIMKGKKISVLFPNISISNKQSI